MFPTGTCSAHFQHVSQYSSERHARSFSELLSQLITLDFSTRKALKCYEMCLKLLERGFSYKRGVLLAEQFFFWQQPPADLSAQTPVSRTEQFPNARSCRAVRSSR